ncbi:hypothetical protein OGV35_13170 [Citrobacter sp. Cb016]|uniref:hypothetical protein n=1 Tax=Citrobacter sp. Cb016 TaxID=2985015 RepID=UPI0015E52304|nr:MULTISPECIES: hypothetical protein [Enterobacteriaceae]MDM3398695.1 hypothetical protein [Citrobacter sp. Cb016]QLO06897.1 hypothetical protein HV141_25875 [Citrobacter freundii]VVY58954.1 Uncharacterised protein [Escherichia coli]VVZ62871.1 Uncharacterised protein [Escherichia coli]VWN02851.1 Uncharacterised protein [Escherichia coli]
MELITPYTVGSAAAVYCFLTLLLYGFYFGKYLLLISASWFGMCFIAAGAERAIQRGGLELILWFVLGLCGFVLAGGVINRVLQVYKYLKKRKPKSTVVS